MPWALGVVVADVASAEPVVPVTSVFSSPPSPVGAGARATGLGSAFIGLADDATAASWNPGGLTQLQRPEMSVVARATTQLDRIGAGERTAVVNDIETRFTAQGETDSVADASLDYLSAAIPLSLSGRNVVLSLNYQQLYAFQGDYHFHSGSLDAQTTATVDTHLVQRGTVDGITAAGAIEPIAGLSIGIALNFLRDGLSHPFAWRQYYADSGSLVFSDGSEPVVFDSQSRVTYKNFTGYNTSFGALWQVGGGVALGAVYKMGFRAHSERVLEFLPSGDKFRDGPRFDFPPAYGAGMSWRPTDAFTVSTDFTFVDWGQFRSIDASGAETLVTGDRATEHSTDGVFTERLGAEYVWTISSTRVAARGGVFHDPEPSRGAPHSFYGGSVGLGVTLSRMSIDLAYQGRFGLDVESSTVATQFIQIPEVQTDKVQHTFYLSIVEYW
ncbi:MAG: hypothetical protein U0610_07155 [bacterium]